MKKQTIRKAAFDQKVCSKPDITIKHHQCQNACNNSSSVNNFQSPERNLKHTIIGYKTTMQTTKLSSYDNRNNNAQFLEVNEITPAINHMHRNGYLGQGLSLGYSKASLSRRECSMMCVCLLPVAVDAETWRPT